MLETVAIGFVAGLSAGITRDVVKVYIKRKRAGSEFLTIKIRREDIKHIKDESFRSLLEKYL